MEKKPDRLYKARLFVMIFEDKRKLLELYNAISGNIMRIRNFWRSTPWRMPSICP